MSEEIMQSVEANVKALRSTACGGSRMVTFC